MGFATAEFCSFLELVSGSEENCIINVVAKHNSIVTMKHGLCYNELLREYSNIHHNDAPSRLNFFDTLHLLNEEKVDTFVSSVRLTCAT